MKCEDCRFWEFVRNLGCSSDLTSSEYGKKVGYCHKNAPTLKGEVKRWPELVEDEWCGDFEAKECDHEDHEWVSADNEVVSGCEMCVKCKAIRASNG